jgi:hypothetical protein
LNHGLAAASAPSFLVAVHSRVDPLCSGFVFFVVPDRKVRRLTKGVEQMHFQIGNLIKMREAGIEDAIF